MNLTDAQFNCKQASAWPGSIAYLALNKKESNSVSRSFSRRGVLGSMVCASVGALLANRKTSTQTAGLTIAGRKVELALASVTAHTIRISLVPIETAPPSSIGNDGVLIEQRPASPPIRFTT